MTIRTCLTIQNNYPDNILITHLKGENEKYAGAAYLLRDGEIHTLLVSSNPEFKTSEAAEKYLRDTVDNVMKMEIA